MEAFIYSQFLLQRNEARRMSGSNTRTTVFNRLVCDGELSKVMTNHLRLKNRQNTPMKKKFTKKLSTADALIHNAFNAMSVLFNGFVGLRVSP